MDCLAVPQWQRRNRFYFTSFTSCHCSSTRLDSSSSFNSIRCAMFIVYFSFNFTLFHLRAVCPTLPPHSPAHSLTYKPLPHIPPVPLLLHAYPARRVDSFYALTVCQSHLTVAYISMRPMALNLDKSSVIQRIASASAAAIFSPFPFHFIPSAKLPNLAPLLFYNSQRGATY